MRKNYMQPKYNIIRLEHADIIASSGVVPGVNPDPFEIDDEE